MTSEVNPDAAKNLETDLREQFSDVAPSVLRERRGARGRWLRAIQIRTSTPRLSIHANRHCPKCQGATAKDWLAARQALDIATWFCDAYAPWQKGAVENINGRLRHDLPRNIDIDKLSDHDLQDILLMHNLTPRKCLRFKTPAQALLQQLGLDIKISFHRGVALHS